MIVAPEDGASAMTMSHLSSRTPEDGAGDVGGIASLLELRCFQGGCPKGCCWQRGRWEGGKWKKGKCKCSDEAKNEAIKEACDSPQCKAKPSCKKACRAGKLAMHIGAPSGTVVLVDLRVTVTVALNTPSWALQAHVQ